MSDNKVSYTGLFGQFEVNALTGDYVFTPNNTAIEGIKTDTNETFEVTVNDGALTANALFTVHIVGANDPTRFDGNITGSVIEDTLTSATGTLLVSDRDNNDAAITPQANIEGTYGNFTIDNQGAWRYNLNNTASGVQALTAAQQVSDTFIVATTGGATQNIVMTIQGTEDINIINGTSKANNLVGTSGADQLNGLAGNDTLDGGLGADTLSGGTGNDSYLVDHIDDTTIELPGQGTDVVSSSVHYTLAQNIENLILTGINSLSGTGNSGINTLTGNDSANKLLGLDGNDILLGNGGNDSLDGGSGADKMTGGLGNDTYTVDNMGDTVTEATGQGSDVINASITFTLGNNIEKLTLTGSKIINGSGNELANVITGNSAANSLSGNSGTDTLSGGAGKDVLTGGLDADKFVFDSALASNNIDTITDFTRGSDKICLDDDVFKVFKASVSTSLATSQFYKAAGATNALDSLDRIIYNTTSGALYYDSDGVGGNQAVQIAVIGVNTHPGLTTSDFVIIA